MRRYLIHDNGGRPFMVQIDKSVKIFKLPTDFNFNESPNTSWWNGILRLFSQKERKNYTVYYTVLVREFNPRKIYVGRSPKTDLTRFSGGYGPEFDGNTILLQLHKNKMVYIGSEIYEFNLEKGDSVEYYVSPVGNNDVPYPTLIGKKNVYFMLDKEYVPMKYIPKLTKSQMNDMYVMFYEGYNSYPKLLTYAKKMKGLKLIHKRL